MIKNLAVIIPLAPGDESWHGLVEELWKLPPEAEIRFSGPVIPDDAPPEVTRGWVQAPLGRAVQMNTAVRETQKSHFWFLHADSRFSEAAIAALASSLTVEPDALHYFDLAFLPDGPALTWLNSWGARFRSRVLGLPFGDQGFCISREGFERLGGFSETAKYGEDHLFVWKAHDAGIRLRNTGAVLYTSARKYRENGWLRTTLHHGALTLRQALWHRS